MKLIVMRLSLPGIFSLILLLSSNAMASVEYCKNKITREEEICKVDATLSGTKLSCPTGWYLSQVALLRWKNDTPWGECYLLRDFLSIPANVKCTRGYWGYYGCTYPGALQSYGNDVTQTCPAGWYLDQEQVEQDFGAGAVRSMCEKVNH